MADYLQSDRRKPDGEALRKEGKKWIERIEAAWTLEKTWHEDADKAVAAYTGEKRDGIDSEYDYNILFSNVETIVPAIINSPPQPDIRRRFADDDPAAKDVSELLERAIRIQVDDSRLQTELEATAHDAFLSGRGIIRLRFKADVEGEPDSDDLKKLAEESVEGNRVTSGDDTDGDDLGTGRSYEDAAQQSVRNERICFEAVSWRDYRHGPAKRWEDRPWEAFRHAIPMEDLETFADKALTAAQTVPEDKIERGDTDNDVIVWEVWCRKTRKVKFIEEDTGKILKVIEDPLGLNQFFPTATPMQPIEVTGRLMPVNPFSIYRKLAEEMDITTRRIANITRQMRVRGWYPGSATDLAAMLEADDTDFVPISDGEIWAQNGGLAGAVAFWPIEKFIVALRELYANREQTKQAIYEITGISDIVRGATKATETLGAQQIKSQWGSLRIQKMQRLVERAARDLFVMMAEIIPDKFSAQTLQEMTGVQLMPNQQDLVPVMPRIGPNMPPEQQQQAIAQAQKAEQARQEKLQKLQAINQLLNSRVASYYRIDVESDSTVRADLAQKRAEQAEFLQGTAAFFQGVAPMVESGALSQEGALEIYAATARLFTLGKSTEDALEREIQAAKEKADQPKPPSPEEQKMAAEQQKQQAESQRAAEQHQMEMQAKAADLEMEKAKHALEMEKMRAELVIDREKLQLEREKMALQERSLILKANAEVQKTAMQADANREKHLLDRESALQKHELGVQAMEAKAKQAKEKGNGQSSSR